MSGFLGVNRYTLKMTLSEQDILRIVMKSRDRISAAAWIVLRDAHAAEDIFQNVVLRALKREIQFPAEGALLSWAFITACRERSTKTQSSNSFSARRTAMRKRLRSWLSCMTGTS